MYNKVKCLLLILVFAVQITLAQRVQFEGVKPVNGTELYCKVIGQGEPLIVVHGGPGMSHDYFLPYLEPLSKQFQLIFFDQRVQGRSTLAVDTAAISIDAMVDDIEGIRQAFDLEKVHVLGHSWGSLLAIRYAAKYPEHLQSLVLSNSVPLNPQTYFQEINASLQAKTTKADSLERARLMASVSSGETDPKLFEQLMRISFRASAHNRKSIKALQLNFQDNYLESSRLLRYLGTAAFMYDLTETAKQISCPTLVIHGKADLIPLAASLEIDRTIPDASLRQLLKSGHFPFLEEPGKFNNIIRNWLQEH